MKLDRRSFLSLGVGAAAGTALSPLPWKLMDDSSIWSQNWPWTPVPQIGEVTYENSVCTLCPGQCGISVRKIAGRAVKVEGREAFPINDGGVCLLGLSGLQLMYGPARIKSPMIKENGAWKKITWEAAENTLSEKLSSLRDAGTPEKLACVSDTDQGVRAKLFSRFLEAFGSNNFVKTPSMTDSYELIMGAAHGFDATPGFDIENSDFILSLGTGFVDGWGSPLRLFKANSEGRDDVTLVQVDSRLSNSAAAADEIIAAKPGTEGYLALGIAAEIIKAGVAKIDDAEGFAQWGRFVTGNYSASNVARLTGVEEGKIKALAKGFAKAKAPLALAGKGRGYKPGSSLEFMGAYTLNAIMGRINAEGGIFANPAPSYVAWDEVTPDATAEKGLAQERIDGAGQEGGAKYLFNKFVKAINDGSESPVDVLLVAGGNPVYTQTGSDAVKAAFKKVPFKVSFSAYMDETAQEADLVLPEPSFLEGYYDLPATYGTTKPSVTMTRPVMDGPVCDTRYAGDVLMTVAAGIDGVADAFQWDGYEACMEDTLGDKWDTLMEEGLWVDEEFEAESAGFNFAALMDEKYFTEVKAEGAKALTLVPVDSMRLSGGAVAAPPFAMKTVSDKVIKGKDSVIEISTSDAGKLRLADGDMAVMKTPAGSATVKVWVNPGIMAGVVGMPTGLGHTGFDSYIGGKGVNFNAMIKPVEDPVTGLDVAWGIGVELKRA